MSDEELECDNCGHDEVDHKEGLAGLTVCEGDGFFENGDPQCDCDEFQGIEDDDED
jgi:hypothetical protein